MRNQFLRSPGISALGGRGPSSSAYVANGREPEILGDFVQDVYWSPLGNDDIANVTTGTGYTKTANGLEVANGNTAQFADGSWQALDLSAGVSVAIQGLVTFADNNGTSMQMLSAVYAHIFQMLLDTSSTHNRARIVQTNASGTNYCNTGSPIAPGNDVPFAMAVRYTPTEVQAAFNGDLSAVKAIAGGMGNFLHHTRSPEFGWCSGAGSSAKIEQVRVWSGDVAAAGLLEAAPTPPFDIVLLAGQSNMIGLDTYDGLGTHDNWTFQWNQDSQLTSASTPLDHVNATAGTMGLDITFSADYRAANPNRRLLLVPSAEGSSGFSDNRWNQGDDMYQNAVTRTNAAMANLPGSRIVGILWLQGEQDALNSMSGTAYAAALDAMIAAMRSDIIGAANAPFVVGEFLDIANASFPTETEIRAAILDTPNRVANTVAATSAGLTDGGDGLHFDAASLRTMGERMYAAWASA